MIKAFLGYPQQVECLGGASNHQPNPWFGKFVLCPYCDDVLAHEPNSTEL
jgi:hypothetical protein